MTPPERPDWEQHDLRRIEEQLTAARIELGRITARLDVIESHLRMLDRHLAEHRTVAVTPEEFWPIKSIVYGLAGLILLTVLAIVLSRSGVSVPSGP